MDNRITKSRLSNYFSYEWILIILVSLLSLLVWELIYTVSAVRLTVYGENGRSCHGALISRLNVNGTIGSPLRHRLYAAPYRTVRLEITGTLPPKTPLTHAQIRG